MNNNVVMIAGASVLSTVVGGVAGYLYAKKKLTTHFEELAEKEIQEAREFYALLNKKEEYSTPAKAAEALGVKVEVKEEPVRPAAKAATDALATYQGQTVNVVKSSEGVAVVAQEVKEEVKATNSEEDSIEYENEVEKVTTNIFVDGRPMNPDEYDMEEERDNRKNGVPYVVTLQEYEDAVDGFEQEVLTYFIGDDTLVDENEQVIDDVEGTVGKANLRKFGLGSGDGKTVYIRNETRALDFEVIRSDSSYAEEVLGLTPDNDLQHSAMPRRRKALIE